VTGTLEIATAVVAGLVCLLALAAWFGVSRRAVAAEARAVEAEHAQKRRDDLAA
jgi:hypothetical protein